MQFTSFTSQGFTVTVMGVGPCMSGQALGLLRAAPAVLPYMRPRFRDICVHIRVGWTCMLLSVQHAPAMFFLLSTVYVVVAALSAPHALGSSL